MTPLALFTTVALAHLLAVMSPGPDFAIVTRQTLLHGRTAGLWTAWGIASGIVVHVAWGLFGLGWLLERMPSLLDVLRYTGAAFLLWMGYGTLRAPAKAAAAMAPAAEPAARRNYWLGVTTNLLNPKAALFFLALFSAIVTGSTPQDLRIVLATWIVLSTGAWFSLVAWSLGHPRIREPLQARAGLIERAMGALLVMLALLMLLRG